MGDIFAPLSSAPHTVVRLIRARLISFAMMTRPLRWLAFGVIALLVVCGALRLFVALPSSNCQVRVRLGLPP